MVTLAEDTEAVAQQLCAVLKTGVINFVYARDEKILLAPVAEALKDFLGSIFGEHVQCRQTPMFDVPTG